MLRCRVTAVTGLQKLLRLRGYSYVKLPGYSSYDGVAEVTEVTGLQLCYVAGLQQLRGCRSTGFLKLR